jgi:hypothetical protein
MATQKKPIKPVEQGNKLTWPSEPEGGSDERSDSRVGAARRRKFWSRFGTPWAWGARHGGTTQW